MKTRSGFALLFLLSACGGDEAGLSGVSGSTLVGEMTTNDIRQLCEFAVAVQGGEGRRVNCGDDVTMEVQGVDACIGSWDEADLCDNASVKQIEACLHARGENICRDLGYINECKPLFVCSENTKKDDQAYTSAPPPAPQSEWDCYVWSASDSSYGCEFEWRCPNGADRKLDCNWTSSGEYYCTCRNQKLGMDDGAFSSSDICDLEPHNVAFRVNAQCGYGLPEN